MSIFTLSTFQCGKEFISLNCLIQVGDKLVHGGPINSQGRSLNMGHISNEAGEFKSIVIEQLSTFIRHYAENLLWKKTFILSLYPHDEVGATITTVLQISKGGLKGLSAGKDNHRTGGKD